MIPACITPRVRARALLEREWDAIVVGSGIGGLACAALLAKRARMRVLVLERHYEIGGLTQTFRRGRYRWEVGVHYVGDVGGGVPRRLLDLACGGRVAWARLPAQHDRLIAPGLDVRLGGDRAALRAQWLSVARGEERAIDALLNAIVECARLAPAHLYGRLRAGARPASGSAFLRWSDRTAAEIVSELGASPRLALLATYPWTNYGSPPGECSFAALAITVAHYLGGAFYPVGGGATLARAMAETITQAGGAVVVRAEVARARVRDGGVDGVILSDGAELRAPIVISDVGARGTFDWLAPEDAQARESVRAIGPSGTYVGAYVGLSRPPHECGLDGANVFLVRDDGLAQAGSLDGNAAELPHVFVSTVCAIDPSLEARLPGRSVLSLATPISAGRFGAWEMLRHAHRGDEYEALKTSLADRMLAAARRALPGLGAIDRVEVSTPLTNRHFTSHPSGEIYGLAPTPRRFREGPGPHTSIRGLYLTGQDVWTGGVVGAALGATLTASAITRRDLLTELALR